MNSKKNKFLYILLILSFCLVKCDRNRAPNSPIISGPSRGVSDSLYVFNANTTDPDGDDISYQFDWGDGNGTVWSDYVLSGESVSDSHAFSNVGTQTYYIRSKAKDVEGKESSWSTYSFLVGGDGVLKWQYDPGGYVSSPAIADDGTIYVGSRSYLYAINPDSTLAWRFDIEGNVHSSATPTIGSDGTIYIGSDNGNLYAINPNGTLKWSEPHYPMIASSTPAIADDGTIYIGTRLLYPFYLAAINSDGSIKWRFETEGNVESSPAIAEDGTIYVGSSDLHLYAINPNGTQKWKYETEGYVLSSPAIASDGTIYVGSSRGYLYAINPDSTLKWRCDLGYYVNASPVIGNLGTIYVGTCDLDVSSPDYGYLFAISPSGSIEWSFDVEGDIRGAAAVDNEGTVYVGTYNGDFYAINSNGTQKWKYETEEIDYINSSPAIAIDGTIYVGSRYYLHAIRGSNGLASSDWPMFHHDLRHTGRQ